MKKNYKHLGFIIVFLSLFSVWAKAQNCIQTTQYPSGTVNIASSGTTNITSCNYGGEYSVDSFTATGSYTVTSSISTDYFTVTDASNNVVTSGTSPLAVTIPSVGVYRIHVSTNSSCGTSSSCRNVSVARVLPPCLQPTQYPTSTTNIANTGTTVVTSCNYGGEYSVNNFTAVGGYTIYSSITTDYLTITDNSNVVLVSGPSPLAITIPSVGLYRVHVSTSSACGTQSSCRTINVAGTPPPAIPNDVCSGAIMLSVGSGTSATTVGTSSESPAPPTCGTSVGSTGGVWYTVVGNGNMLGADLCTGASSGWDSKIFVYTGTCGAFTCVTGNDDAGPICNTSAAASVTWCSIPSTTYYVLVQGYSGASAFSINITQTVNVSNPTLTAIPAASASLCLNTPTNIGFSGANTYSWSTSATTSTIAVTPTANTVYTVTGFASGYGSGNCGRTVSTISVNALALPTVAISANTAAICPGGSFVVTPSGASTYSYVTGTTTLTGASATLNPIVTSVYTVSGTGSNGCRALAGTLPTLTISTLASPTLVVSASPASVCPGVNSTLSVTGANTYTWAALSSNANSVNVNANTTTIYTVSGTGTTICNGVSTITLSVYPTPTVTVNSGTICSGYNFTMSPSGASTYTFASSTGTVTNIVSPVANNNYTVTGTSVNGCLSTASVAPVSSVAVIPSPTITATSGTVCLGSSFTLAPTGSNGTYSLNGVSTGTANLAGVVSPIINTTYSVSGTNTNGCVSPTAGMAVVNITVVPLPTISIASSQSAICIGQATANLSASGANTYTWSNLATTSSISVSPSVTTIYSVAGTSTLLCSNFNTVSVLVNPLPVLTTVTNNTFVCVGGPSTITASGASSYLWNTTSTLASIAVNPTVNTVYTCVGTDSNSCTNTITAAITVNTLVLTTSPNSTVCLGSPAALTANGAVSYTWNGVFAFQSFSPTPTGATVYTVVAVDANNCVQSKTVSVGVYALPNISIVPSSTRICIGESAVLNANGGTSYQWSTGASTSSISISPTVNVVYNYSVVGVDNNSCTASANINISVDACVGLKEAVTNLKGVSVYPNPNNGEFTVELKNDIISNVIITDVTGRVVLTDIIDSEKANVSLGNLANGVYYVQVVSGGNSSVVKVVKQ